MIKRFLAVTLAVLILCSLSSKKVSAASDLCLSAESAALMSFDGKELLYSKNADKRLPMASTTKIMTALVVLESCELSKEFIIIFHIFHINQGIFWNV